MISTYGRGVELNVIQIQGQDMEILGPDYCSKRPVFLPPNQTRMPLNGTMNLHHLTANSYPLTSSALNT